MAKRWYYKDENGNKVPVPQYKIDADDYYTKTMSDSRYYEKSATDTLLGDKVSKSDIVQSTGTSTTAVMSQKAVTDVIAVEETRAKEAEENLDNKVTDLEDGVLDVIGKDLRPKLHLGYNSTSALGTQVIGRNYRNSTIVIGTLDIKSGDTIGLTDYIDASYSYCYTTDKGTTWTDTAFKTSDTIFEVDCQILVMCRRPSCKTDEDLQSMQITTGFFVKRESRLRAIENDVNSINNDVSDIKSKLLDNEYVYDKWQLLGLTLTSTKPIWSPANYRDRICTHKDFPIHLKVGDKFALTNYSNARYEFGYYDNSGIWHTDDAWKTTDLVVEYEGDYHFFIAHNPEPTTATGIDTLSQLVVPFKSIGIEGHVTMLTNEVEKLEKGIVIQDYWLNYIKNKTDEINEYNNTLTAGESFVFITDYHVNTNCKNSISLIDYIIKNSSICKVFYGGDTTDGGGKTDFALRKTVRDFANAFKGKQLYPIRGNHDIEPTTGTMAIDEHAWYDIIVRPIENYNVNTNNRPYYTVDNKSQKIMYIVLDSGSTNHKTLNEEQLTWLQNSLQQLSDDYTAIIFVHMFGELEESTGRFYLTHGRELLSSIHNYFNNLRCTIGALVFGHSHNDILVKSGDSDYPSIADGYPLIATTCDSNGVNADYDIVNPSSNRLQGTTNEQAFDVFSIDTSKRTIKIIRIGVGEDRYVNY